MAFDYSSLLFAVAIASAGLSVTLFFSWLSSRTEGFILTWAAGGLLVVGNAVIYSFYVASPSVILGMLAFGFLMVGLATVLGAAFLFRDDRVPVRFVVVAGGLALFAVLAPWAFGYDGLALMAANFSACLFLCATAFIYWTARSEAPIPIYGLATLYAMTGVSFALCGGMLVAGGLVRLGAAPDNWAENLNLIVSIAGLTGIGALSLALNQSRLARSHRRDALTDPLTGLVNRRALFGRDATSEMAPSSAVIVFDLDHFKAVNDRHGHAIGDAVIRRFADVVKANIRVGEDSAARLGGEEFAVVLRHTTADRSAAFAERIRRIFEGETIATPAGSLSATVSAGVAFVALGGYSFDRALSLADEALYSAKREGRNRVVRADAARSLTKENPNADTHRPSKLAG